ncbi:MAG: hypothetical protein BWY96_00328 [Spirochaetes bacterium ADurb.BinA120]|nr:MAG: hypothetical protein BWY96_00328 [Spirochaetes bacterium ADurb.BinA120]
MKPSNYLNRMDKTAFSVTDLASANDGDVSYWLSRPPRDRFAALEILRRRFYPHDAVTGRLQRFFEIAELPRR